MKRPDVSSDCYSDFTALTCGLYPAHSGPELALCVPQPGLAQELARTLLTEHVELTHNSFPTYAGPAAGGMTIGLARR